MGLIEDEDLVAVASRRKDCSLPEVTSIINTVVAGSVNLNNI